MSASMTSADLRVAMRERYAPPAYALLFEVRNGTGYSQPRARSADAIGMSLWPSRGLELMGFEIKVSRGDWLRELKDPAKAEEISAYCHRWWIVVADKAIVHDGELPPTWGLLAPRGKGLVMVKEAPRLDAKPVEYAFLAALLRRAQESSVQRDEIESEIRKAREEEQARVEERVKSETWHLQRQVDNLQKLISEFEAQSGMNLHSRWDLGNIAKAVEFVRGGGVEGARREMERVRAQLRATLKVFDEQLGATPAQEVWES